MCDSGRDGEGDCGQLEVGGGDLSVVGVEHVDTYLRECGEEGGGRIKKWGKKHVKGGL